MASFTDKQIPTFNPYVQQLPVQAMVEVGMQKQKQYDEGVQKIQTQINNVAGLDFYKDVDKTYLQSKLNALGNNLRGVAGGDFSNSQLVTSVGGMVSQIGKDSFIQNGVSSTAKLRKQLTEMDRYKKEGKSDKNNEQFFYEKFVNPYLNSGLTDDRGAPIAFSGEYSPYVNITEEIQKQVKDAGIESSILEQMFQTDTQGNIKFNPATGEALPARTMTHVEESSNAKAVQAIINNVLKQGNVQNQIHIDAWANTKNVPVESILSVFATKYEGVFSEIDQSLGQLNTLLTGKTTPEQKLALEAQKKKLSDERITYEKQYTDLAELATKSPDAFKESYYRTNFQNSLVTQFTDTTKKITNLTNPLTQQLNNERDFRFKQGQEAFDQKMALRAADLADLKFTAENEFDRATGQWKAKPKEGEGASGELLRLSADVPGTMGKSAVERTTEQLASWEATNYANGVDVIFTLLSKGNNGKTQSGKPLTKNDILQNIKGWSKSTNETPQQFVTRWILNLDNKAKDLGVTLTHADKQAVADYKTSHYNYTTLLAAREDIYRQVAQTGVSPEVASKQIEERLGKFTTTDDVFSFTPTDEKEMKIVKNRVSAFISNATNLAGAGYDQTAALKALTDPNSKVSFKASAPYEVGGTWKGVATITDDTGKVREVNIDSQNDFEQLTGQSFNAYKFNPLQVRAATSQYGSTNLGAYTTNPDAWQTAAIPSEELYQLRTSTKYTPLGADLVVMPRGGGYIASVYVKNNTTKKVENVEFDRIYLNEDIAKADLALLSESMITAQINKNLNLQK